MEFTIEFTPPGGNRLRFRIQANTKEEATEKLKAAIWQKTTVHLIESGEPDTATAEMREKERQAMEFLNKIMGG